MPSLPDDSYEYRGLLAESWDLLRGDTSNWPDRHFYWNVIQRSGQPVLDVGCGTGRLLLDYLSHGVDIDGVDISPEMLALCRARAEELDQSPSVYLQAMDSLDLPRRYWTILVPSSSFQLLLDEAQANAALERFLRHLEPGGTLVMSIMDLSQQARSDGWVMTDEVERPEDGVVVRRWNWSSYDPETQLEDTQDRFELIQGGSVIKSEHHKRFPATRSYTLGQILDKLEGAGFVRVRAVSQFTESPATTEDDTFCVLAERPLPNERRDPGESEEEVGGG